MNLVKRKGASGLVLTMLIWSVISVLGTRLFLELTNYPIIGRGQWHIAHMLFGGVLMMVAGTMNLIFRGERWQKNMAVFMGIGWGLFIDEVGKLLTRDNNYWFRPAVMIIYISFVIIFLIYKLLERHDRNKKGRITKTISKTAEMIAKRRLIMYGLWIFSIYYSVDKVVDLIRISIATEKMSIIEQFYHSYDFIGKSDIYLIGLKIVFDVFAAILFLLGARYFWTKKRQQGIRLFRYGLYVSILLGGVFKFYFEQLGAVVDILISAMLLEILNGYNKGVNDNRYS